MLLSANHEIGDRSNGPPQAHQSDMSDHFPPSWIHGAPDCHAFDGPAFQVHPSTDSTFIIRQHKCLNFEGPFLYLLVGEQTAPQQTLLVNSKTRGKVVLHTTFKSQRDRVHFFGETHSSGDGDGPPRLNQQSHNILYSGGELTRPCPGYISSTSTQGRTARKRRPSMRQSQGIKIRGVTPINTVGFIPH